MKNRKTRWCIRLVIMVLPAFSILNLQEAGIKISDALGKMKFISSHWNEHHIERADNRFTAQVPARDVLILEFES